MSIQHYAIKFCQRLATGRSFSESGVKHHVPNINENGWNHYMKYGHNNARTKIHIGIQGAYLDF